MIGIGVVGVGSMGRRHAEHLATRVPGARLIAVADTNPAQATAVADACASASGRSVLALRDVQDLLSRADVDAVVIAGPGGVHKELVVRAASAGKQIFCEKPLALTTDDARAATDAAAVAGVTLQVGFMRRYDPAYAAAKRQIEAGTIGRPVIFKALSRDPKTPPLSYFQSPVKAGIFLDSAIHDFDLARWLIDDEVARVSAFGGALASVDARAAGAFDSAIVNLIYDRGALGNVECYWHATYGYDIRTEIVGERGTIAVGAHQQTDCVLMVEDGVHRDHVQQYLVRFEEAYLLELRDFVARLEAGAPPRVSGVDGIRSVAISVAAGDSLASGGGVTDVPRA